MAGGRSGLPPQGRRGSRAQRQVPDSRTPGTCSGGVAEDPQSSPDTDENRSQRSAQPLRPPPGCPLLTERRATRGDGAAGPTRHPASGGTGRSPRISPLAGVGACIQVRARPEMPPPTPYSHFSPWNFGCRRAPLPNEQRFPIEGECGINRLSPRDNWGALQHHGTAARSKETRGVPTRSCPVGLGVGDTRSTSLLGWTPRGLAPRPAPGLRSLRLSLTRGRGAKELRGSWPKEAKPQKGVCGRHGPPGGGRTHCQATHSRPHGTARHQPKNAGTAHGFFWQKAT